MKLDDRHKHQHALADRSHGHQEPRPHKQERERDAHHSRPARDIPSRTARLEASRNKAADPDDKAPNKAADKAADQAKPQELPPPPTKSADDKQVRLL